ncbi:hypothetical protein ACTQ33_15100 [Candidatus Avoscillospira sp. LCP25S3_F1]|uniref:hypothetical protein n=1 Tax=Candidatus Avoscillospira sp. LCP25S3_F1 TaxID=3438825 RepID=UPI003F90FA9C
MRKNRKYLAATALVLVAALGWTGLQLASGQEVYHAPELVLLEGQAEYDLLSGIEYDTAQYELAVMDLGGFDIDTLGEYTLRYMLTPLNQDIQPEQPETPVIPEEPGTPEEPDEPTEEEPVTPEEPPAEEPETPVEPGEPVTPEEPPVEEPETPVEPGEPVTPEEPPVEEPETSVEPEEPVTPEEPPVEEPETSVEPDESITPEEPTTEETVTPDEPATDTPEVSAELLSLASKSNEIADPGETADSEETTIPEEPPAEEPETPAEEEPVTPEEPPVEEPETPAEEEPTNPEEPPAEEEPETPEEPPVEEPQTPVEPADPIYFTRQVVVTEAVTYEDVRLDQGSEDLLTGITSAAEGYQIAVVSDGGFDPNRIEEYEVTYSLRRADNGKELRQFTRYVQVTLPGVEFTAPELVADGNLMERDWLEGIEYDESRYILTLLTPPDLTSAQPQRLRYSLTLRPQLEQEVSLEPENLVLFSQEVSLDGTEGTPEQDMTEPTSPEQDTTAPEQPEQDVTEPTTPEQDMATPEQPEQDVTEPTTPEQDMTEPEQPETEGTLAAIFGREVTILAEHLVTIDAPPLVLTMEELATIDLLEGVTATDETGKAVEVTVKDSSELEGTPADTLQGDMPSMSPSGLTDEPQPPANGGLGMGEIDDTTSLEPGTYTITLAAVHPLTGEEFTVQRTVTLLAETAGVNARVITEDTTIDVSADPTPIQINGNITLTLTGTGTINPADDTGNAIDIVTGHLVTIVLADGANVTLYGKDATAGGTIRKVGIGGGAALHVPNGVTLFLRGTGMLTAIGGNAAKGGDPGGRWSGGAGGGGAGAAIGGNGSDGGVGGYDGHTSGFASPSPEIPGHVMVSQQTVVTEQPGAAETYINQSRPNGSAAGGGGMGANQNQTTATSLIGGSGGYAGVGGGGGGGGSAGGSTGKGSWGGGGWNGGAATYNYSGHGGNGGASGKLTLTYQQNIVVTTTDGTTAQYESMAEAFWDIQAAVDTGKSWDSYIISFGKPASGYTMQTGEWSQISEISRLPGGSTVTIRATAAGTTAAGTLKLATNTPLVLPLHSHATFTIENIKIAATAASAIAANGSNLTMGEGITVTGTLDVVGGGLATANPEGDTYTFTGDTNLTIRSGTYRYVAAGSRPYAKAWAGTVATQGSNQLTLGGGTGTVTVTNVLGLNLIGNGTNNITNSHIGSSTVTLHSGATVTSAYAGSRGDTYNGYHTDTQTGGAITIQVNTGAAIKKLLGGTASTKANSGQLGQVVYQINGTASIPTVQDFDQLILEDNAHLTVTTKLHYNGSGKEETAAGQIVFGKDSVLTLPGAAAASLTAGSLKTTGDGAVLEVKRGYPLNLVSATDSTGGKLTLRFNPSTTSAVSGDKVLYFSTQKNLADSSHYLSGFPGGPELMHDQITGYVYVATNIVTLQTNSGTAVYYPSVAAAMEKIETTNNANNNYTITIRRQHYTMTEADLAALDTFNGKAKSITFTSTFALTANDILESGETTGKTVTRHIIIDGDLSFRSDTTLQNIYLEYQGHDGGAITTGSHNIYANGHALTMGTGVDTGAGNYPTLYGGSKTEAVSGTTVLIVQSGQYQDIYGGGEQAGATVGGTSVRYEEFAVLHGSLYGGGKAGDVTGNTSVTVAGGTTGGSDDSKVVAGGETGDVSGMAQLVVSGGTASKTMVLAGADNGTVESASIEILEPNSGVEPSAPRAHVYGGAYGSGSVTGDVHLTITNGTYYGTISGGNRDGTMPGGSSTISFSGSDLKMMELLNFDTLNLGYDSAKCNLSVTGKLDSNTAASGTFNRTGAVVFNNGSVLNLTGRNVHTVGSIRTMTMNGASHLHITKADGVSYPLYISLGNTSEPNCTINVGIPDSESAPDLSRPAEGDDLLIFADESQVDLSQYLCGLTLLAPVQNPDIPAIVELGIAAEVQAKLTGITHTSQADTTTAGSNKTLSFLFTNISDTGAPGQAPTSAYIDRTATADSSWISGGAVPAGALGGELTAFTPVSGQTGQWTGQITLDVEALDTSSPQFYYLHVRAPGSNRTIILDVYAPEVNKDVASTTNGQGDYTFTIQIQDKAPAGTTSNSDNEDAPVYENAGLYQVGWSLTAHDPNALTKPMTIEGVQTISDDDVWLPYDWSFEVTAEQLAGANTVGDTKVLYLYLKDTLGNTRMITVPMNEHQVDVSIPTRVGIVAMKGVEAPKVSAPQCALINYGTQTLNASVTQVRFTAQDNELTLVERSGSPNSAYASNEIDLRIKPLAGEQGYAYSLANLTSDGAAPLKMGQMGPYSADGTGNQIGFTFDALYNPQTIMETTKWSMFYLSYQFEAVSDSIP